MCAGSRPEGRFEGILDDGGEQRTKRPAPDVERRVKRLEGELRRERARQSFAAFYSPGTIVSEKTRKPCRRGDVKGAVKLMEGVEERHGATPFGFVFEDGNGKSLSGVHFVTGKVMRYDEIPETDDNHILRSNMRCNNWPLVVENRNSYRSVHPFKEDDVVVDKKGNVVVRGDNPELVEYRKAFERYKE